MNIPIPTNRILELRSRMNLTQEELGKLTDQDKTTVNKHENMARGIQPMIVKAYAKVFKVETYEIFFNPEDMMTAEQ